MQQYKFNGDYDLRVIFNCVLSQKINILNADIIVPIPVSDHTMVTRGFNQTTGLIEGIQYEQLLKVSAGQKSHQSQFNRKIRMMRKQPFMLIEQVSLEGKEILLVDDVYTTGNTLYHAADLLYECGAKNVKSISLSR
ncbi:ComF family protein [Leuconostoc gelidum]|uniref:ComF family protein n=1 Tax=Leuconostoc gelidum TaxID=1244 RepID=UPI001CC7B482|nr:phosphoribosyltransferase family protein [Leuconostoc gelidum]